MRRNDIEPQLSEKEKREKEKRRIAWMIEQKKLRDHEELKRKKIEEYERKRAAELALTHKRRSPYRSPSRSRSRSRSKSEESHYHRSKLKPHHDKTQVMSEKLNSTEKNKPFFKGPNETPKYNENELRLVTVKIVRNIAESSSSTNEIKREVNPEEIQLKRREGNKSQAGLGNNREGSKPIFDRDEFKQVEDVEEHRVVQAVGRNNHAPRPILKRRSASLSPRRRRSRSPVSRSSSHSQSHNSRYDNHRRYSPEDRNRYHNGHKDDRNGRYHSEKRNGSREDPRSYRSSRTRTPSRERDHYKSVRDYNRSNSSRSHRSRSKERPHDRSHERPHDRSHDRPHDRSHDRRERRESSRDRHMVPHPQYMEPVPFPYYYGPFPPRPMIIGPPIPSMRAPMMRGGRPMAPRGPFHPPRFINPQEMYPQNPDARGLGRMF